VLANQWLLSRDYLFSLLKADKFWNNIHRITRSNENNNSKSDWPLTKRLVEKILLICGIFSSLLYVGTDTLGGTSWKGYSLASQAFSDLPAIYSPVRQVVLPLIIAPGAILFAFALGVWISAGRNRPLRVTAAMLIGDNVIGLVTPVFFPPSSSMHAPLTGVEVIFILLAMGFGAAAFRKWFRIYSIGTILILIITGVWAFMQVSNYAATQSVPWLGAIERILIYSYLLWVGMLAFVLLQKNDQAESIVSVYDQASMALRTRS
jgi:uncharacterized membrane protein SirB2